MDKSIPEYKFLYLIPIILGFVIFTFCIVVAMYLINEQMCILWSPVNLCSTICDGHNHTILYDRNNDPKYGDFVVCHCLDGDRIGVETCV